MLAAEADPFALETVALRDGPDPAEARRQPPVPVHHAVAGHPRIGTGGHRPADLAAAAWPAQQLRDLAVRRDPSAGDPPDDGVDRLVPRHQPMLPKIT